VIDESFAVREFVLRLSLNAEISRRAKYFQSLEAPEGVSTFFQWARCPHIEAPFKQEYGAVVVSVFPSRLCARNDEFYRTRLFLTWGRMLRPHLLVN